MKVLLTLACSLAFIKAAAQLDYVVTSRGDTLHGVAKIYTYDVIDRVHLGGGKEKYAFTAIQVREVSMQREIYHPVRTEAGYYMMKLVKSGFISMYLAHQPKSYTFDTPYLVKKNGQSMEVPNLSFKKMMVDFLGECAIVREKVKNGELGRRDLEKIVDEFNECTSNMSRPPVTTAPPVSPERLAPITALQSKIENDSALPNQKDALDILRDISEKVKNNQSVPKYLAEGLKEQLKDAPQYQEDVEKVLAVIK